MALSTESSTPSTASKSQIRSSLSRWQGELKDDLRPLFNAFVNETLNRLRGPFLAHHPPKAVLTMLEEAFRFALERPRAELKVEIRKRPGKGVATLVNMADQPFIVDTVRLFLRTHEADYWGGFNLVFRAVRDESGRLVEIGTEDGHAESLLMLEADAGNIGDPIAAADALKGNLDLARAMVADFKPMTRAIERFADRCEVLADRRPDLADGMRETASFLSWLLSENFVFMGVDAGEESLGIQRVKGQYWHGPDGDWPQPHFPGTVHVRKSHIESPVHRSGRIDEILIVAGEGADESRLFIRGMFTYRAVTQPSRHVPILRRVLADILNDQTTTGPGSFRYKGLANVFDSLPTEFLFTATRQSISELLDRVFEAEQSQEVGVTVLMNGSDRAFCLVAMPKTRWDDELRQEIEEELLATTHATYSDHGLFVGRYDTVLLHYFLTGVSGVSDETIAQLTERIRTRATPWLARLWSALAAKFGESEADRLADTYGRAFPEEWTRTIVVDRAVRDIEMLERLAAKRRVQADVFEAPPRFSGPTGAAGDLALRVYQTHDVNLSDLMPVLTSFGVKVIDSDATLIHARGGSLHVDTFRLEGAEHIDRATLIARAPLLTESISQIFDGKLTDDPLNGLVLVGGLSWTEVDMIRGYVRYSRQLGNKLSVARMTEILLSHPICIGALVRLFHARFDPDLVGDRAAKIQEASDTVVQELRYIQAHDEDLLLSMIRDLILATVRTNYYRTDRKGSYLSFKVDGSKAPGMGKNRPMFEIYVHSRDVEGVHLRFGKVARGGLRWSDRDDYRAEVLGLVTTQQVKNVVIVPTGSKGGFLLKNASRDMAERRAQANELYKTFIRGMLDLTDNSVHGKIVPPPRVVRHDQDDPYLVVAADKGTAHLSDTANAISREYDYWLGDAFASGGSHGYDHKKVGITARGAWVLVRRHFAEMGIDPYTQDITVAGIGDMGGDVFGNGLIESRHLKLVAAFNHLHIFLDPNPDPAKSYEERLRLFRSVSGWDKYDPSLISAGGGVFDRRAKSVPLSPQARELLGIDQEQAQPEEVISAILKLDVDLLWNGGIGTYVKASTETHADANDKSNDATRIDAIELRAKVVGEGGNLGFTQRARIEANLNGVRINADAIDNSGGVDLSDHEVNLKILLNPMVARGEMTLDERNKLLEEMTEEVAGLVLNDNDTHGRQLSRDQVRSRQGVFQFGRAISFVEREFGIDRARLALPNEEELLRRSKSGQGLTRPELAVLSAWVKMYVKRELAKGDPKQLVGYEQMLRGYFPKRIQERFPEVIQSHMLGTEIAITVAVTRIFADAGAAFFPVAIETTGCSVFEIAQAYRKAQRVARMQDVRSALEELRTHVSLETLYRSWVEVDAGAREVALYWLSSSGKIPSDELVDDMRIAAERVYELQAAEVVAANAVKLAELKAQGIPDHVAALIQKAQYLNLALTVWAEARRSGEPSEVIAKRYLAIGRASGLLAILEDLQTRPATGRFDPLAMRILHGRFQTQLREIVAKIRIDVTDRTVDDLEPELASGVLADVRARVQEVLQGEANPSVATLLVLLERVTAAIARL